MTVIWDRGDIKVRDACGRLASPVAYNTVKTAMERLFKKGLLTRSKVRRAFVYRATATKDELEGAVATRLVRFLFERPGSDPLSILSSLVDAMSDRDRALLDDMERLIREKHRSISRRTKR